MSAVFFVRQLGKVRGPFSSDHVSRLVAAGRIGSDAEVSTDRSAWRPLTAHPGLGGSASPAREDDDFELDLSAVMAPAVPAVEGTGSEWFDSVELGPMGDE